MEQVDNLYLRKVSQYMRSLPRDHPDTTKFVLEQAAIRVGKPFISHLVNLQDPNWQENFKFEFHGRNRFEQTQIIN